MTTKKPPASKGAGINLNVAGCDQAAIVARQKEWVEAMATRIERRGAPRDKTERAVIAWILRGFAARMGIAPKKTRRGNPNFPNKLPDDDSVAFEVAFQIAFGATGQAAIANVAEKFEVDASTVGKRFRAKRKDAAKWFVGSNLGHRVGAIRGK